MLRDAGFELPVYVTAALWDRFIVAPLTAPEQRRGARMALLLVVARSVLAEVPAGRDFAAFSFQVKNRPLYWDTVHAWIAIQVGQPDGLPALVIGFDRIDENGVA